MVPGVRSFLVTGEKRSRNACFGEMWRGVCKSLTASTLVFAGSGSPLLPRVRLAPTGLGSRHAAPGAAVLAALCSTPPLWARCRCLRRRCKQACRRPAARRLCARSWRLRGRPWSRPSSYRPWSTPHTVNVLGGATDAPAAPAQVDICAQILAHLFLSVVVDLEALHRHHHGGLGGLERGGVARRALPGRRRAAARRSARPPEPTGSRESRELTRLLVELVVVLVLETLPQGPPTAAQTAAGRPPAPQAPWPAVHRQTNRFRQATNASNRWSDERSSFARGGGKLVRFVHPLVWARLTMSTSGGAVGLLPRSPPS